MLSCWRTMLPALVHLRFESPPRDRNPALPAEVADVVKVAALEAGGAVGCHDWSYLSHAPNVGTQYVPRSIYPQPRSSNS